MAKTPLFYRRIRHRVRKFLRRHDLKSEVRFLPMHLLEAITRKERYMPTLDWSYASWTHNAFRAFEFAFGREYGIRPEMTSTYDPTTGRAVYMFHTLESAVVHFEAWIRGLVPKFRLEKVYIPVLQPAYAGFGGMPRSSNPYLFAIAVDATSSSSYSSASSRSHNHTCTGSDRILIAFPYAEQGASISAQTYNSTAMSLIRSEPMSYSPAHTMWAYYLTAPSTGSNAIATTYSGSCYNGCQAVSYSGVEQTSPIEGQNSTHASSGSTISTTVSVTSSNSWLIASGRIDNTGTHSGTNDTGTVRNNTSDGGSWIVDSNGTVATGTRTAGMSNGGTSGGTLIIAFNIIPPAATNVTVNATVLSATVSTQAPSVTGTANVTPSVLSAAFSAQAPSVSGGATVAPNALTATFSIPAPNIITPDAQADAGVVTATFSTPAPTVSGNANVSVGVLTATFSIPSSSVKIDVQVDANAQSATFTTPAPTISAVGNVSVSATVVTAVFSTPSPTITSEQNAMVEAGVLTATFSIPSPTVTAVRNVTIDASVVTATFSTNAPTKIGGLWTAQPRTEGVWTPQARAI